MTRLRPISWLPRISLGLTIAQLSERLRAELAGEVDSVKPGGDWRMCLASRSVGHRVILNTSLLVNSMPHAPLAKNLSS